MRQRKQVGKKIGGCIYVHKDYATLVIPVGLLARALLLVPSNHSYTIIKHNHKTNAISFIECECFDKDHEPEVGLSFRVMENGNTGVTRKSINPFIYHHKWLMVTEDYGGFDISESMDRSKLWKSIEGVDTSLIGRKKYWDTEILPQIEKKLQQV